MHINDVNIDKSKILLVDDTPQNLKILGSTLAKYRYELALAKDGFKAIEVAKKFLPDLILLDVNMPGMDGFTVCQKLKEDIATNQIPIIFITALSDTESLIKGFEVGGVDYITKPFNVSELIQRVHTHLKLKKSTDLINKQNDKLEELNASKNQFFSILAHDLRGPFNGSLQLIKLIIDNKDLFEKDDILEIIEKIYTSQSKQVNLVESLLDWSRIQSGSMEFNPEKLDVKEIIDDLKSIYSQNLNHKNIDLEININEDSVIADKFMLTTTIRNLLNNAIKFTPENGRISINVDSDNDNYLFLVEDSGIGISEEDIIKIFRIDVHNTKIGNSEEKGAGLGLKLCKDFVEKHNGKLWIESKLNIGSSFNFTIPKSMK